jgi:hypothetical protein
MLLMLLHEKVRNTCWEINGKICHEAGRRGLELMENMSNRGTVVKLCGSCYFDWMVVQDSVCQPCEVRWSKLDAKLGNVRPEVFYHF